MIQQLEVRFKSARREPIRVAANEKCRFFPRLVGGSVLLNNLLGDSEGRGVGPVLIRLRDVASVAAV